MKVHFPHRSHGGFTLIELIIVIAILATLAGIAYPTYMSIQENASKTAAKKVCTDIVEGVTRFAQDYNGMMPYDANEAQPDAQDQIYLRTKAGEDARLIMVLTNREEDDADNRINTNRDTYLRSDEQEQPRDGLFIDANDGINFYDPWGQPYYLVLCEEEKGCIDPFTSKRLRGKKCLVYSLGADGEGAGNTEAATSRKGGKKGKKGTQNAAASAEADAEAIEDNVYSWKNPK
ncbi:MAG: type II secretion system protein [Akkermansia sp.]